MTPLFDIRSISCHLDKPLFQDFSLCIPDEAVFMIMGPSGCGKSTLLRFLNRLRDPDGFARGQIFFRGTDLLDLPIPLLRKKVGMLFQLPALPQESVRDNILYGPRLHRKDLSEDNLHALLETVVLDRSFLDRRAADLSVGERQRVQLARVLANEPEVVLLDEPTASLDPQTARELEGMLKNLTRERGLRLVWVTHDPGQRERVGPDHHYLFPPREVL